MSARPAAVAVVDLGKTHLKLVLVDARTHAVLDAEMSENRPLPGPPYPHLDTAAIFDGLVDGLARAARRVDIRGIVPITHGSTLALIDPAAGPDGDGLVLPVMDYEADPPDAVAAAYADLAPPFDEVFAPTLPGSLTLARQLLWQETAWPSAFRSARQALLWPQYWTWRLTGAAVSEVTSLGAQSHLWDVRHNRFSSLARARSWDRLFPALAPAWATAGPVRPGLAGATGLAPDTPVLVGLHDSNANLYRYRAAGLDRVTLLSTGTWLITFAPDRPLDRLDPARDTVTNTDVSGRPVACSRFMAGREYALVAGDAAGTPAGPADAARVVASGALALPSFTDTGGPCPGTGGRGRIDGAPPDDPAARAALATLYTALMTDRALDAVGAGDDLVIDGGFAENALYAGLVAALRPGARVRVSTARDGAAIGAALLAGHDTRTTPVPLDLAEAAPAAVPGLDAWAARWRAAVDA